MTTDLENTKLASFLVERGAYIRYGTGRIRIWITNKGTVAQDFVLSKSVVKKLYEIIYVLNVKKPPFPPKN